MPDALVQFAGSLAAILALFGLAKFLKLGPDARLETRAQAIEAARQADDGFEPVEVALDSEGRGALVRDAAGAVMLLRPHGAQMASRILTSRAAVRLDGEGIVIDTAERRFGQARLVIDQPQAWVQHIEAMKLPRHA